MRKDQRRVPVKLQAGKKYVRGDGTVVLILAGGHATLPFKSVLLDADSNQCYEADHYEDGRLESCFGAIVAAKYAIIRPHYEVGETYVDFDGLQQVLGAYDGDQRYPFRATTGRRNTFTADGRFDYGNTSYVHGKFDLLDYAPAVEAVVAPKLEGKRADVVIVGDVVAPPKRVLQVGDRVWFKQDGMEGFGVLVRAPAPNDGPVYLGGIKADDPEFRGHCLGMLRGDEAQRGYHIYADGELMHEDDKLGVSPVAEVMPDIEALLAVKTSKPELVLAPLPDEDEPDATTTAYEQAMPAAAAMLGTALTSTFTERDINACWDLFNKQPHILMIDIIEARKLLLSYK